MESGSFSALATATSLGLMADRVVLALESIDRSEDKSVPEPSKELFGKAAEYLQRALDAQTRSVLPKQITRRAVLSKKAYRRAIEAAKVSSRETTSAAPGGDSKALEGLLSSVMIVLEHLRAGHVEDVDGRNAVRCFFSALSEVATADYSRLSQPSIVRWGRER